MLSKIISGGQTGADQAALDSAIKFNIAHGGWVPKGRKTEDGILPEKYFMDEMETSSYPARTRQNIIDSDATLIIAGGDLTGGSLLTKSLAKEIGRPYCHIDFISMDDFEAAMLVHSFIIDNNVEVLNVAGPRKSSDLAIYSGVRSIIESMIYMIELASDEGVGKIEFNVTDKEKAINYKNIDNIVEMIASKFTLKTKAQIAALDNSKIASLYYELSDYLMEILVYKPDKTYLFQQFLEQNSKTSYDVKDFIESDFLIHAGDFIMTIVKKLKLFLEEKYLLRVIK